MVYTFELIYNFKQIPSVFSPPFLFTLGFLVCATSASLYWDEWELNKMSSETFWILLIGVLIFNKSSLLFIKKESKKVILTFKHLKTPNNTILLLWLIFEIVYFFLFYKAMLSSTDSSTLADAASSLAQTKDDDVSTYQLPAYIGPIAFLIDSLTYLMYYYFASDLVIKSGNKLRSFLLFFIVVLSVIGPIMCGSRGTSIVKLMSFLFILYFMYVRTHRSYYKTVIPAKIKVSIISLMAILGLSWSIIGDILGRTSQEAAGYVFAIYCGAEIKNLDSYISEGKFGTSEQFGHETFFGYYLSTKMDDNRKTNSREKLDLPYRTEGGLPLGNVYTCFYSFLHDFGYLGVPILALLMSFISSSVWNGMKKNSISSIMCIFLYSILSFGLLFSFFSNKFFETFISFRLLKIVLFLWIVLHFFKFINFLEVRRFKSNNSSKLWIIRLQY